MKKQKYISAILAVLVVAAMLFTTLLIGPQVLKVEEEQKQSEGKPKQSEEEPSKPEEPSKLEEPSESERPNVLIAYFSCTNTTKGIAEKIAEETSGTLYEIQPEISYSDEDLNYNNSDSRATREQNDASARPAIRGKIEDINSYQVLFLGYPIWWGQAPRIISTFLESYDFSGKIIIPFCTSGSSGIGSSARNLHALVSETAEWKEGRRFSGSASKTEIKEWIDSLTLFSEKNDTEKEEQKLLITVGNTTMTATLAENSSTEALKELLAGGPLTIEMSDYGNFEKVGPIGTTLPRNDEQITTKPGDLILYQGSNFVIYYDTNSWNFTKLGEIDNRTAAELKDILGSGDVSVTLSIQ